MPIKNIQLSDLFLNYVTGNQNCLIINNSPKINSEKLSYFKEITNVFIGKNKSDFSKSTLSNFKFIDINNFENYFQKNSFDLIIIYNWPKLESVILINFLKEITQILKTNGNLLFPFKKQDDFKKLKIEKILKNLNFKISRNWIVPSLENPIYSGNLNDLKSLLWFFQNLENFIPSFKKKSLKKNLFLKLIKTFNKQILSIFIKFLSPSLLVCCSQNKLNYFESKILIKTKLKSSILVNRPFKLMYILFDTLGNPKKTASINKKDIFMNSNVANFFQNLEKNVIYRDWVKGRIIDPLNTNEILLAIDWLIKFQNDSESKENLNNDLNREIDSMKQLFSKNNLYNLPLIDWLHDYENFIKHTTINKTNVHGDLSHKNMIISPSKKIQVIDFDYSEDLGNPLDDILNFIFRYLIKSKHKTKIDSFNLKLIKYDKKSYNEITMIEKKLSQHFNYNVSVFLLMKIYFLKNIYIRLKQKLSIDDLLPYATILANYK